MDRRGVTDVIVTGNDSEKKTENNTTIINSNIKQVGNVTKPVKLKL